MKKIFSGVAVFVMAVSVFSFGEAKEWSLKDWLKKIEAKVFKTEKKYKNRLAVAAAVRGSKSKDEKGAKLYWKGKKKKHLITQEELDEFKESLAFIKKGKEKEAKESLLGFLEKYPDSPLTEDAQRTMALLSGDDKTELAPLASETDKKGDEEK